MGERLFIVESDTFNPYENLALEEYLLFQVPDDARILYLWQNDNTVVIGQNQNPYTQCDMKTVQKHQVNIARRLSGGGAVYHDMGNLNYTFIAQTPYFSIGENTDIIINALKSFGVQAEKTGRNDIECMHKKISGNAFYNRGKNCYHHGTILVDCDLNKMQQILRADPEKWRNKGVESVRSRVGNISEFNASLTMENVKSKLKEVFQETYGGRADAFPLNSGEIEKLHEKYKSDEWIWGRDVPCSLELHERFAWGGISVCLGIEGDVIRHIRMYSDSLKVSIFPEMERALQGKKLSGEDIGAALDGLKKEENDVIVRDVEGLLKDNI